jgi:hypothetical protein
MRFYTTPSTSSGTDGLVDAFEDACISKLRIWVVGEPEGQQKWHM